MSVLIQRHRRNINRHNLVVIKHERIQRNGEKINSMACAWIGAIPILTRSCDHSDLLVVHIRFSDPFSQDQFASVARNRHALGRDVGLPCVHV